MVEADTGRQLIAYKKEVTYGVPVTGSGVYRFVRYNSDSIAQTTATKDSEEIRGDRNVVEVLRVGVDIGGDLVCEFSRDAGFEELLQSSLEDPATWATPVTEDNVAETATSSTITRASGDFTTQTDVGDYIMLAGFGTTVNNRPYRVKTVVALTITLDGTPLATPFETPAAGKKIVYGTAVKNVVPAAGIAIDSFTFEKEFSDLGNFAVYTAVTIMGFNIGFSAADDFIMITFNLMGSKEISPRPTSSNDSGTIIAAGLARPYNAVDDVKAFTDNAVEFDVTAFNVAVNNNHRTRRVAGTLGAKSTGSGKCNVTGNVTMFFEGDTQVNQHLAFTNVPLALIIFNIDSAGNEPDAYVIELPKVNFTSATTAAGGQNQDITHDLPFIASQEVALIAGETVRATIRIWKFK